jgi:hypothetical protein
MTALQYLPVTSSSFGSSSVYEQNFLLRRYSYAIAYQKPGNALS